MTKSKKDHHLLSNKLWFYERRLRKNRERGYRDVEDPFRGLIAAVVVQAIKDLRNRDPVQRLSAWQFLTNDGALWLEGAGLSLEKIDVTRLLPPMKGRKIKKILEVNNDNE